MRRLLAPVLLLAGASLAQETGYNTTWSGHRTITVNSSAAGITANVLKFPTLVRLTAADTAVFRASKQNGADIRFTKGDNATRLKHQIDRWDSAGRKAEIWVLLDTVYSGANSTFRMHWGNTAAADSSNGNAVFDTANGYLAAWHLGNAPGVTARPNAVVGGNAATPTNFPVSYSAIEGVIGMADTLRGGNRTTGDWLALGTGYNNFGGRMTLSMWVKPEFHNISNWNQYISLSNGNDATPGRDNIWLGRRGGSANLTTEIYNGTASGAHSDAANVQTPGEWQLLAWTANNADSTQVLYRNGVQVFTRKSTQGIKDTVRAANHIGRAPWDDPTLRGVVDETRLAKVVRSADWFKLEYLNQNPVQSLLNTPTIPTLSYNVDSVNAEVGFSIAPITVTSVTGQPAPTYTISPALPAGLTLTNGVIAGTPTAVQAKTKHVVTATNSAGTATDSIWIAVKAATVSEDYATWTGTKTVIFSGTAAVSRFPLLVRLSTADSAIFTAGRNSLRFSKPDGGKLRYSIDTWDSAGKSAAVWVLMDNVVAGNNSVRLHWGKAGAASQASSQSVFETANGFAAVYHMGNPVGDAQTTVRPNSANPGVNDATPTLPVGYTVKSGVIGLSDSTRGGADFANSDGFTTGTLAMGTLPGQGTISLWAKPARFGSATQVVSLGGGSGTNNNFWVGKSSNTASNRAINTRASAPSSAGTQIEGAAISTSNNMTVGWDTTAWQHVLVSMDNQGRMTIYKNGSSSASGVSGVVLKDTARVGHIARSVYSGDDGFYGNLDEVRISSVARSADWANLEYRTQAPGVMPVTATYPAVPANYIPGTAIATVTPTVVGTGAKFTVSPSLPAGLALDSVTGAISGTPTAAAAQRSYTITATNGAWISSSTVNFSVAAADGAYASAWSGHKFVNVNTMGAVSPLSTRLLKFPILVRLGAADSAIFNAAQSNGADIRFTKLNNTTRLHHEIDMWDKANKRASVWVLLDTAYGSSAGSRFRMHYGNATVADSSKPSAVFDSSSYLGVWHMGNVAAPADPRPNAVAGGAPATPVASTANFPGGFEPKLGVIGMADTLRAQTNGTNATAKAANDHFSLGTSGYIFTGGQVTMSLWMHLPSAWPYESSYHHFMTFGNGTNTADNIWIGRVGGSNTFAQRSATANGESGTAQSEEALAPLGEWANFTITRSGANGLTYQTFKNGVSILGPEVGDESYTINPVSRTQNYIGRALWGDPNVRMKVDEARVLKVARSAPWVKLEYENQKPTSTVISFTDAAVPITTGVNASALMAAGPALGFKRFGQGLMFQVRSDIASSVRISILDMHGRTVWNHTAKTDAGMNQISWNGVSNNGQAIGSGVFAVRMTLLDENGKSAANLVRRVPLTR